jgi:hypothetical protein
VHSAVVRDGGGGWGRRDGAVWLGALVGVVAFGLWGDAVVGIAILGVAAIGDAMAFLVRRVAARRRPQVVDSLDTRRIERAKLQHR